MNRRVARGENRRFLAEVALAEVHLVVADVGRSEPAFQRLQKEASPPRSGVLDRAPTTDGLQTEHDVVLPRCSLWCPPPRRVTRRGIGARTPRVRSAFAGAESAPEDVSRPLTRVSRGFS